MLVFRAEIHKMLVRISNRQDPDQTASSKQSDLGLHWLSRRFWEASSVKNFRTFMVLSYDVASESEITPRNKIDKPLVVYRFTGNVMTSITTLQS